MVGPGTVCSVRLKMWSGWKMEIWGKRLEWFLAGWLSESMEENLTDCEIMGSWTLPCVPSSSWESTEKAEE